MFREQNNCGEFICLKNGKLDETGTARFTTTQMEFGRYK